MFEAYLNKLNKDAEALGKMCDDLHKPFAGAFERNDMVTMVTEENPIKIRGYSKATGVMSPSSTFRQWLTSYGSLTAEGRFHNLSEEHCVFMLWTGLVDKNGVEIFDGDIVKCTLGSKEEILVVKNDTFKSGFKPFTEQIPMAPDSYSEWTWSSIEVIGDIYRNPDLIPK